MSGFLPGRAGGNFVNDQDFSPTNDFWLNAFYDSEGFLAGTQFSAVDVYQIDKLQTGRMFFLQTLGLSEFPGNDFQVGGARFSQDGNFICACGTGDGGGMYVWKFLSSTATGALGEQIGKYNFHATTELGSITGRNSISWSDNDAYIVTEDKVFRFGGGTVTSTATGYAGATTFDDFTQVVTAVQDLNEFSNTVGADWAYGTSTYRS